MKSFALVVLALSFVGNMQARVGETEKELIARFGNPVSRSTHAIMAQGKMWVLGPQLNFTQDDWRISCDIVDGRVARESYGKAGEWTEEQFRTVLTANAQGERWTEITVAAEKPVIRRWRRVDGATVVWMNGSGVTVVVPAYDRAKGIAEAKAKADAAKRAKI